MAHARTVSRTPSRLRIKIDGHKNDAAFFEELQKQLTAEFDLNRVTANPETGSVLLEGDAVDPAAVGAFGQTHALFSLAQRPQKPSGIAERIGRSIGGVNAGVRSASAGELDLPSLVFVLLLISGAFQLLRGNFSAPPWYTAFWYAFGVFTKSIADGMRPSAE